MLVLSSQLPYQATSAASLTALQELASLRDDFPNTPIAAMTVCHLTRHSCSRNSRLTMDCYLAVRVTLHTCQVAALVSMLKQSDEPTRHCHRRYNRVYY